MTDYVFLTGMPVRAQLEPQFIIQVDSVYYLTKAIWEYDASKANDPEEDAGCAAIREEFHSLSPDLVARQRASTALAGGEDFNQTN